VLSVSAGAPRAVWGPLGRSGVSGRRTRVPGPLSAQRWAQAPEEAEAAREQELRSQGWRRPTPPAGGAPPGRGRRGPAHPAHRIPGRGCAGQNVLDMDAGCPHAWARHSPARGALCRCGADGDLCRVGDQAGGGACATEHPPVGATLAKRHLVSGRENASGAGRVPHAERCRQWDTLGSGVRGVCARASGLSCPVTDHRPSTPQHPRGSVSPASASAHPSVDPVCPRPTPTRTAGGRSLCPLVRQATDGHGEM
jgi:hypothetical protein